MGLKKLNSIGRILLAVLLALPVPRPVLAEPRDAERIAQSQDVAAPTLRVSVEDFANSAQEQVLAKTISAHPDAPVTVFYPEGQEPAFRQEHATYVAVPEEQINEKVNNLALKHGHQSPAFRWRQDLPKGLLITLGTASSFSGSYFIVTGNVDLTAKLFVVATVVNGFQVIGTTWEKYLHAGGEIGKRFWRMTAKVLGKAVKDVEAGRSLGSIAAVYGFNVGTASLIFGAKGAILSALLLATFGAIGAYDAIWDLVTERKVENGTMAASTRKKIISLRLALGPPIEATAYSGTPLAVGAAAVMGVIGSAGLLTYLVGPKIKAALEKWRGKSQLGIRSKLECSTYLIPEYESWRPPSNTDN